MATMSGQPKGMVLSIEYRPLTITEYALPIIKEFINFLKLNESDDNVGAEMIDSDTKSLCFTLSEVISTVFGKDNNSINTFSTEHTILQYMNVLSGIRTKNLISV